MTHTSDLSKDIEQLINARARDMYGRLRIAHTDPDDLLVLGEPEATRFTSGYYVSFVPNPNPWGSPRSDVYDVLTNALKAAEITPDVHVTNKGVWVSQATMEQLLECANKSPDRFEQFVQSVGESTEAYYGINIFGNNNLAKTETLFSGLGQYKATITSLGANERGCEGGREQLPKGVSVSIYKTNAGFLKKHTKHVDSFKIKKCLQAAFDAIGLENVEFKRLETGDVWFSNDTLKLALNRVENQPELKQTFAEAFQTAAKAAGRNAA